MKRWQNDIAEEAAQEWALAMLQGLTRSGADHRMYRFIVQRLCERREFRLTDMDRLNPWKCRRPGRMIDRDECPLSIRQKIQGAGWRMDKFRHRFS